MNKKIAVITMTLAFTAATVFTAYAFTCKVTSVDGKTVILKCKDKDTGKLTVGGKAKVKKKVEGC